MLQVGEKAPDFTLEQVGGGSRSLNDVFRAGHHALLIFLRHLG